MTASRALEKRKRGAYRSRSCAFMTLRSSLSRSPDRFLRVCHMAHISNRAVTSFCLRFAMRETCSATKSIAFSMAFELRRLPPTLIS